MWATIAFDGRAWWCIVQTQVEVGIAAVAPAEQTVIGVDLGLADLLVASDHVRVAALRPLRKAQRRLARAQRVLSRRKKGSKRRKRQAALVRRLHVRVADCRRDAQHKATAGVLDRCSALVIEDLDVAAMARKKHLATGVADAGLGEIRRQLTYKATWRGKALIVADRYFRSTQTCANCGTVKLGRDRLGLAQHTFCCSNCGIALNRDFNAALNLRRYGLHRLSLSRPDPTQVGQAVPEPAEIHSVPPPDTRGETRLRAGSPKWSDRNGSTRRESTADG